MTVVLAFTELICYFFVQSCFTNWHARSRTCALCKKELHAGDWEVRASTCDKR